MRYPIPLVTDARMRMLRCMHNLALKGEVAAVAVQEDWPSYMRRITNDAPPKDIANTLNVNRSLVDRWLNKDSRPTAENVVAFARAYNGNPQDALVAAGYLDQSDIRGTVKIVQSLAEFSDAELIREVQRRMHPRINPDAPQI